MQSCGERYACWQDLFLEKQSEASVHSIAASAPSRTCWTSTRCAALPRSRGTRNASGSSNSCWQEIFSPVRALVAHRHLSIEAAQNAKLRPRCRPLTHKRDVCRVLADLVLAGKSYFGKNGLEGVSIAASAPPAIVMDPQGTQLMVLTEALT
jgi:hypothetical protein